MLAVLSGSSGLRNCCRSLGYYGCQDWCGMSRNGKRSMWVFTTVSYYESTVSIFFFIWYSIYIYIVYIYIHTYIYTPHNNTHSSCDPCVKIWKRKKKKKKEKKRKKKEKEKEKKKKKETKRLVVVLFIIVSFKKWLTLSLYIYLYIYIYLFFIPFIYNLPYLAALSVCTALRRRSLQCFFFNLRR